MNFSGDDGNDLISDLSSQQEGKGLKRVRKVSIEAEEGDETSSGEDTDEDEEDENGSCVHQGMTFRDGEAFTANVSGLPIANVDQCLQCQCQVCWELIVSVSSVHQDLSLKFSGWHGSLCNETLFQLQM